MINYVCFIFMVAMLSAFVLLLFSKLGVIEWLQVHGNRIFSQMAQCTFCLSWWTNVIFCAGLAVGFGELGYDLIITPFIATPVTRKMIWQ